jgi:hypothetical protein
VGNPIPVRRSFRSPLERGGEMPGALAELHLSEGVVRISQGWNVVTEAGAVRPGTTAKLSYDASCRV